MFDNQSYRAGFNELDLRKELDLILFGDQGGPRHGHLALVRRFREVDDKRVKCTCFNELTKEGSHDCIYCDAEGYLWDEFWIWTYSMYSDGSTSLPMRNKFLQPGRIRKEYKTFFLRYDTAIQDWDKIVEVELDLEGRPITPYKRKYIFEINTLQQYRSDNGRLEYYVAHCRQDDMVRVKK